MENTDKSNRKIHIIFAIFTLFLSFGLSFSNISAFSLSENSSNLDSASLQQFYDEFAKEKILSISAPNDYFNEKIITLNGYSTNNYPSNDPRINYQLSFYVSFFGSNSRVTSIDSNFYTYFNEDIYTVTYTVQYNSEKGYYDHKHHSSSYSNLIGRGNSSLSFSTSNVFDVDGNIVFQKPPLLEVGEIVKDLPVVVGLNSQVIIGGTICLLALMIFLAILVRHLRTVSRGS